MSFLSSLARSTVNVLNFGNDVLHRTGDVGSRFLTGGRTVGSTFLPGAETLLNFGPRALQFQADLTRVGLERTWNGIGNVTSAGVGLTTNFLDGVTHPGTSNPPAAQGLAFAETKGASDLAYDANRGEVYRFANGTEWEVVDVQDDSRTGFRAVALRSTNPNDDRVIVAYAGTRDKNDWDDNIRQAIGLSSPQYSQAVEFANKWKGLEGSNVILTGHSLGGGLASYASIKTGLHATAINSAPLALNHLGLNPLAASRITQYYVPGEVLTVFDQSNPANLRPGNSIAVRGRYSFFDPRSIGRNHGLDAVAPGIASPVRVR